MILSVFLQISARFLENVQKADDQVQPIKIRSNQDISTAFAETIPKAGHQMD